MDDQAALRRDRLLDEVIADAPVVKARLRAAERWRTAALVSVPSTLVAAGFFAPVFRYGRGQASSEYSPADLLKMLWDGRLTRLGSQDQLGIITTLTWLLLLVPVLVIGAALLTSGPLSPTTARVARVLAGVALAIVVLWILVASNLKPSVEPDRLDGFGLTLGTVLLGLAAAWAFVGIWLRAQEDADRQ